jgi:hypothetical protein
MMMRVAISLAVFSLLVVPALADPNKAAPETPATDFHGLPGNNPAYGGKSANPNGQGPTGGGGIHNIGANPGQSGNRDNASDGDQPSEDMHGGLVGNNPGHSK